MERMDGQGLSTAVNNFFAVNVNVDMNVNGNRILYYVLRISYRKAIVAATALRSRKASEA